MASQPVNARPNLAVFSVCDDVRAEQGNKFTLVGFYARSLTLQTIPSTLPKLAFFAQFDSLSVQGHDLIVRLINPSGTLIFETPRTNLAAPNMDSPVPNEYRMAMVVFQVAPLTFTDSGVYTVEYEFSEFPPYRVNFFVALQPSPAVQ